jgi:DnaJ-class molecular chaperone
MTTPSKKSNEMNAFLDQFSKAMFEGVGRASSIARNTCVTCKGDASSFKDELSEKEFTISGMCQTCQDEIFEDPPVENPDYFSDISETFDLL